MFERFTYPARQTVVRAVHEAERRKASRVTEEHIALALLGDPDSEPGGLLAEHETRKADIEAAFEHADRRGGLSESDTEALRELGIEVSGLMIGGERQGAEGPKPRKRDKLRGIFAIGGHIPFSAEAKRLLERTLREAISLQHRELSDLHILLAVLANDGIAAEAFGKRGVTYEGVRTRLRQAA